MAPGLARTVQQQWNAGMYRNGAPELIPVNGLYDVTNGLYDLLGDVFRRGGSSNRSSAAFGTSLRWIWDGWLNATGHTTLIASPTEYGRLEPSGAVTALGHAGLSAPGRPAVYKGVLYLPGGATFDGATWGTAAKVAPYYTIVANRLVAAQNESVYFSKIGEPANFGATDYHTIPGGVQILGIEGGRDSCVVFTTGGVWVISNMAMNLVDEKGNVQQRLDRFSADLVLWGASGLAGWEGNIIVPGTTAVWMLNRGITSEVPKSFSRLSDEIVDLYREYVKSGYSPGGACVHENHYLLPILGLNTVVDLLACRLDTAAAPKQSAGAWSRLQGSGAKLPALTSRVSEGGSREPELLGVEYEGQRRVLTLSYFTPTQVTHLDADGTIPKFSIETRSYPTGQQTHNLVARMRLRYRCSDNESSPMIKAEVAGEQPVSGGATWGGFSWGSSASWATPGAGAYVWGGFVWGAGLWASTGTSTYRSLSGEAPESIDGTKLYSWRLHRKVRYVRFRLSCSQPTAQLVIKQLEVFTRQAGRV